MITGKSYVGSANCLSKRFKKYFSASYLKEILKRSKCIICNSLLKNGYENFQLEILEYIVFPSGISIKEKKEIILGREQYYLDTMKPEYNILKIAGSRLGSKHSKETKLKISINKISINKKGIKNPLYGKHITNETKLKIKTSVIKTLKAKGFF